MIFFCQELEWYGLVDEMGGMANLSFYVEKGYDEDAVSTPPPPPATEPPPLLLLWQIIVIACGGGLVLIVIIIIVAILCKRYIYIVARTVHKLSLLST